MLLLLVVSNDKTFMLNFGKTDQMVQTFTGGHR